MRRFTELFRRLDRSTRTGDKLDALRVYFSEAPAEDAAWAVWFLSGHRPKRAFTTRQLRGFVGETAGVPDWLVEESHEAVGDLGETLALLLDTAGVLSGKGCPLTLARLVEERLLPVALAEPSEAGSLLRATWRQLSFFECFLFQKLLAGTFRVGVSKTLLTRALAEVAGVDRPIMAHRLMGTPVPTIEGFQRLMADRTEADDRSRPYPFFLAHPWEGEAARQGSLDAWQIEWKWDGIRAQFIRRSDETLLWSRGEEMIGAAFPEIMAVGEILPEGTVLDGELLAWRDEAPLPFGALQRRLGRKRVPPAIRSAFPVVFMAYDLLEHEGRDLRPRSTAERRALLEALLPRWREEAGRRRVGGPEQGDFFLPAPAAPLRLSPRLYPDSWQDLEEQVAKARDHQVEGVMLKRVDAAYGTGREKGSWWKWKVDPLTIDVVLVGAQPGHGRRAGLYTDYTFAVRDGEELVTVAKAYSGLTQSEIEEVDRFVRGNTLQRHGPVRSVKAGLVFELAFEGLQPSSRHRSGIALRFPRIHRWRRDKPVEEIDSLASLRCLAGTGGAV